MYLVEEAIRGHLEECGESLTYEEAKKHVPGSAIEAHLDAESRGKWRLYQAAAENMTVEQMKVILALSHEEVDKRVRELPENAIAFQTRNAGGRGVIGEYSGKQIHCKTEPIVPIEVFERVQEIMKKNAANK